METRRTDIHPDTRVLNRFVTAALERQKRHYQGTWLSALILLPPNSMELPMALIEDIDLEPVDKLILLSLMSRARRGDGVAIMPTHAELARSVNVVARQTVACSLAILRCRRWMTVCRTSWRRARLTGSAYALHASPLPIEDTIYLDPRYRDFLAGLADQHRVRTRNIANDVLDQLSKYHISH